MSVTESKAKTERKSSRKPAKTQETVLSALLAQTEEVSVPLASLIKSPLNVRTVPYSAESVSELADSIKGVGLLQNLVVHALPGDRYGVAAGGRRLAALNMLAERDIIQVDWPVRVKVIPQELATAASMTENGHRRDMHPAEQIAGFPVMQQSGCFRRCGFVSGSAVAINPRWSCRSTAASRHGRQSRKPVRTRRWSLRLKSNWHSIRRKQSEAGMHAGVTGWQSMTWKPCSGSGASVFRHWPEWNAGSGRICRSGRLLRKPVLQQERPVTLSVRWSGGWCRTNSGRQRDAATITQITRKQPE